MTMLLTPRSGQSILILLYFNSNVGQRYIQIEEEWLLPVLVCAVLWQLVCPILLFEGMCMILFGFFQAEYPYLVRYCVEARSGYFND